MVTTITVGRRWPPEKVQSSKRFEDHARGCTIWFARPVDIHLVLDREAPLRAQLERELRAAIRLGRLRAGAKLPASRVLADELQVSRGVVVEAYAQLTAEGYLTARAGDGTRIADGLAQQPPAARAPAAVRAPDSVRPTQRRARPVAVSTPGVAVSDDDRAS